MGDSDSKQKNEKPRHTVSVKGFWMARYEVTQSLWTRFSEETPAQKKDHYNHLGDLYGTGDDFPMYYVSWNDAREFCRLFKEKTGITVRLPTEAEWEYACRAGTETEYYWGEEFDDAHAWVGINSEGVVHPVGQKKPNAWGLFDMSGNVYEWCEDWYGYRYYRSSPSDSPRGPETGRYKVIRGGSFWNDYLICLRSAYRFNELPDAGSFYIGFRLVKDP
jgi:formylglycine-generating enzyme required for sulfatase activity